MRIQNVVGVVLALVFSPAVVAQAEGPQPAQPVQPVIVDPNTQQQVMADPNAQYGQVQAQPAPDASANAQAQQGRGIEYGAYLMVPIFMTTPHENTTSVEPGLGLVGRIGWEFGGGLTLEGMIGGHVNNATIVDRDDAELTNTFTNVFVGGGIRYSFLNPSALVPFLGAGLQLNLWGASLDIEGDSIPQENDYVALGASAVAGLAYEVSADLAIEGGLRADFTTLPRNPFGTSVFDRGQLMLSPFLGATLYY
jgi:hypothetical protein